MHYVCGIILFRFSGSECLIIVSERLAVMPRVMIVWVSWLEYIKIGIGGSARWFFWNKRKSDCLWSVVYEFLEDRRDEFIDCLFYFSKSGKFKNAGRYS